VQRIDSTYYLVAGFVVVAVVVAAIIIFGAGGKTAYGASITNIVPYDPSHVVVDFDVTNTGPNTGTPTCQIVTNSPGGSSTGLANFEAHSSLLPRHRAQYHVVVAVTPVNGAYSVTINPSSVTCH